MSQTKYRLGAEEMCTNCRGLLPGVGEYCPFCGIWVGSDPPEDDVSDNAGADTTVHETPGGRKVVSSSDGRDGTDPHSRQLYLASLDNEPARDDDDGPNDGGQFFRKLDRAEQRVELLRSDLADIRARVRERRAEFGDLGDQPAWQMSPIDRHRFIELQADESLEAEVFTALGHAERYLDRLYAQHEAVNADLMRPVGRSGTSIRADEHDGEW